MHHHRLPHEKNAYRRLPQLRRAGDGVQLDVVEWSTEGERVVRFRVGEAAVERIAAGPWRPEIPELDEGGEPTSVVNQDRCARDGDERCEVIHAAGVSTVRLHRGALVYDVYRARGIAMAPALVRTAQGTVVAFHTNVREDTGEPDVPKWIALRCVDAEGRVLAPSEPMTDLDRDRAGEEQSFEFPTLVVGIDGAICLLGRGSHDHFRQDLNSTGFTPRRGLSDGQWGSRGRRVAAVVDGDRLVLARRDRHGIEIAIESAPCGGPPSWAPTPVNVNDARPTPRLSRQSDPAERWGLRTCFGDIQQHSAHSDGIGTADEVYLRARDHYHDDFVALTDHESFLGKRTAPGEWRMLRSVADRYQGSDFATLHAYEWTGAMFPGPGHKCVYPADGESVIVSRDDVPVGRRLIDRLAETGALASPHHIGWTGADESAHDEGVVPVWEICSCHGCYEHADHPLGQRGVHRDQLVDVMLRKGLRFGFTASSDSHGLLYHHGECRKRDPYRTGLTAVQVASLDRASILEALRTRRCYATSGAKILLDVSVDGAPMGSFLERRGAVRVDVRAVGEGPIARVDAVGPEGTLATRDAADCEVRATFEVEADFVYVRVVQTDGEMAWSSPVFLSGGPSTT